MLFALLQHLFAAVALPNLAFYARFVWPLNMVLLGLFSIGIFAGRERTQRAIKNLNSARVRRAPMACDG